MKWLLVLALCASAAADTGGRMGGGSWKSGGSSSSSYRSSSSSSSSSHSWSTPTTHTYSPPSYPKADTSSFGGGTHWSPPPATDYHPTSSGTSTPIPYDASSYPSPYQPSWFWRYGFWILFFGISATIAWSFLRGFFVDTTPSFPANFMDDFGLPADEVDVSVLRVAVDGRARKFVQSELARIAKSADTGTDEGRVAMLREVALMLRRLRDAWVYGGAVNEAMGAMDFEKSVFDHHVDDARVRFREETVSNVQGVATATAPSAYTPRSDEGAGVILVSIILAARRELFTVSNIGNGSDLAAALEAAGTLTADTLVAVEIVWQPSEDADRLSSMELEAKYPMPDLIPIAGALVGKTFCTHCGGPFPAELVSCPHCGAPAPGRQAAA